MRISVFRCLRRAKKVAHHASLYHMLCREVSTSMLASICVVEVYPGGIVCPGKSSPSPMSITTTAPVLLVGLLHIFYVISAGFLALWYYPSPPMYCTLLFPC